jgi:hypothetical protein
MKRNLLILFTIVLIGFVGIGTHDLRKSEGLKSIEQIKLNDSLIQIKKLELEKQQIREEFDQASKQKELDAQKLQELEQRDIENQKKIDELQKQVQAKKDAQTVAKVGVTPKASASPAISGTKEDWLRASGIPESEWWAVDSIVSRESSWNPNAVNPSSGACGLGQQLPCGKWAGAWNDPVAALKAQYGYVVARYGGYPQAVAFWNANHWY